MPLKYDLDLLKLIFHGIAQDFPEDILPLLFHGTTMADLAATADLYVSLHTADLGRDADQSTAEAVYDGYSRVAVPRTEAGWHVYEGPPMPQVSNAAPIGVPRSTAGTPVITAAAVGTAATGAGHCLYWVRVNRWQINLQANVFASFGIGDLRFNAG
ncbi:MAG: hypothetical protein DMG88_02845 [Acidobacteria bacterium]|nr:MAG: hypothetical protein DMG88_02845 [Acidobacteriota bacterium]